RELGGRKLALDAERLGILASPEFDGLRIIGGVTLLIPAAWSFIPPIVELRYNHLGIAAFGPAPQARAIDQRSDGEVHRLADDDRLASAKNREHPEQAVEIFGGRALDVSAVGGIAEAQCEQRAAL